MPTLAEQVSATDKRQAVIRDLVNLIDSEVSKKGGLSGLAIKGAYAVVKAIKPTFIGEAVDGLLDDCVKNMEGVYAECAAASGGNAGAFQSKWNGKAGPIADSLLKITDERAVRTRHQTAKKAYDKLRPSAKRNVEEAVPGLGQVISRHAAV